MEKNIKIAITGGGSGGHLNAAIAVIKELQEKHPGIYENLVFIGGTRGMVNDPTPSIESRKIPELGVRFVGIRSGKLQRKLSAQGLKLLGGVAGGFADAMQVLKQEKPDLVFSTGGYVTVPVVIMAKTLGIKSAIHEQTIASGLANRIASKFTNKVFISFPDSARYFPRSKTVLTGSPLQKSRFDSKLPKELDKKYLDKLKTYVDSTKPFLFITGGGLGSHVLNKWLIDNAEKLSDKYNIIIQTGENQYHDDYGKIQKLLKEKKELAQSIYPIKWFGDEIGFIYSNADLVISRPGANSVLELLATNRKAVLIPIPWSSSNEQYLNAQYFCDHQAGEIVEQADIQIELKPAIERVLEMHEKDSAKLIERDAAVDIVKKLMDLV